MSSDTDAPFHLQPFEGNLAKLFFLDLCGDGEEDWPPWNVESIWAQQTGPNEYMLLNSPFFAKNVSYKDIVATAVVDGVIAFQSVVRRSGYSTYLVLIKDAAQTAAILKLFDKKGFSFEGMMPRMPLYSVSVQPTAEINEVFERLDELRDEGALAFEEGYFFDGQYEITPSGWEVT